MIYKRKSTIFLLPLILNGTKIERLLTPNYIGTYYQDTNKPEWGNKIILVYELNKPNLNITLFYCNSPYKYDFYTETINNTTYGIYCFIVPPIYKNDYNKIINGEYNKLTNATYTITNAWIKSIFIKEIKNALSPLQTINTLKGTYLPYFDESEILNLNQVPINKKGVQSNTLSFYPFFQKE